MVRSYNYQTFAIRAQRFRATTSFHVFLRSLYFVGGYEGTVTTDSAISLLLSFFLEPKIQIKRFNLYINSPGGMVTAGLAYTDTMQYIRSPNYHHLHGNGHVFRAVL